MNPERLRQILDDASSRDGRRRDTHQAFADVVVHDWKKEAAAEALAYFTTVHGKRAPRAEQDRIRREIESEHRSRWQVTVERALTLAGYAHSQEVPTLEAYRRECEQPPSAAEAYEVAVADRGGPERPLMLALLEGVTRRDVRAELSRMPPTAALEFYRAAVSGNGVTPDAVVRTAVLIAEVERRGDRFDYDAKGEHAANEHAASLELTRLVAATKASRVPAPLQQALTDAAEGRRYAETMRTLHRLQVRPLDEVLALGEDEGA